MGLGARRHRHRGHRDLRHGRAYGAVKDRGQLAVGVTNPPALPRRAGAAGTRGVVEPVEPELHATSWVFPAWHRLRLALAGSDWRNAVPPPAPVTLTVERDGSVLTLPVLPAADPSPPPPPPAPRAGQAAGAEEVAPHPAPDATSSPDTAAAFTAGSAQPRTPGHRCAAPDPPEPAGRVAAGT